MNADFHGLQQLFFSTQHPITPYLKNRHNAVDGEPLRRHRHADTFHAIKGHMNKQAQGDQPKSGYGDKGQVNQDRRPGVERVEPDTAAGRIKNRGGQKMIQVHHHGQDHDQPCLLPSVFKKCPGHGKWYDKMKRCMNDDFYHRFSIFHHEVQEGQEGQEGVSRIIQ